MTSPAKFNKWADPEDRLSNKGTRIFVRPKGFVPTEGVHERETFRLHVPGPESDGSTSVSIPAEAAALSGLETVINSQDK